MGALDGEVGRGYGKKRKLEKEKDHDLENNDIRYSILTLHPQGSGSLWEQGNLF